MNVPIDRDAMLRWLEVPGTLAVLPAPTTDNAEPPPHHFTGAEKSYIAAALRAAPPPNVRTWDSGDS
jgi:hypothetical protein